MYSVQKLTLSKVTRSKVAQSIVLGLKRLDHKWYRRMEAIHQIEESQQDMLPFIDI